MKSILSGIVLHHFLSFRTLVAKVLSLVFAYASGMNYLHCDNLFVFFFILFLFFCCYMIRYTETEWCLDSFALVVTLITGLSVGKEGPFVHVASMVARNLCRIQIFRGLWQNEMLRAQVLAAACAAGVSATFGTPVGGM